MKAYLNVRLQSLETCLRSNSGLKATVFNQTRNFEIEDDLIDVDCSYSTIYWSLMFAIFFC